MFPQEPNLPSLDCDRIYTRDEIRKLNEEVTIFDNENFDWVEGINRISQKQFEIYGIQLLQWCSQNGKRVFIISHDGTITNYRILLGEQGLTRQDFLGEAGVYKTHFAS